MKNSDKKYTKLHAIFFQTPLPPKKIIKKRKEKPFAVNAAVATGRRFAAICHVEGHREGGWMQDSGFRIRAKGCRGVEGRRGEGG